MNVYIYCADVYCEDCGRDIRERLESLNPDDITSETDEREYDSDEYPKGPYCDGGGEADSPQHCGSGADCLNAIVFPDGHKVGAWLENPLTSDGVEYVRDAVAQGGEVADLWAEWYSWELSY